MNLAEIQSLVKRVNQRYTDIVKQLGYNSNQATMYRDLIKKISTNTKTKSGYEKIGSPSKLNADDLHLLKILNKKYTYGQYRKKTTETMIKRGEKILLGKDNLIEKTQLKEYSTNSQRVHEIIRNHKDAIYNTSPLLTQALRRTSSDKNGVTLTLSEMDDLLELYNSNFTKLPKEDESLERLNDESLSKDERKQIVNDWLEKLFDN